jgi:CubicO group peptidase (beta-lactamase class C family)
MPTGSPPAGKAPPDGIGAGETTGAAHADGIRDKIRSGVRVNLRLALALVFSFTLAARAGDALALKLQHFVDQHVLAGAVMLVADKDKVFDIEAVGYSDLAAQTPMKTNDLFWIASMSKPVTCAALMMLVDARKVSLDDPVEKYIPEFKAAKVALTNGALVAPSHPIKIREILSHTSGLGFLNARDKQRIDSVPLAESIRHDLLEPLKFDPGTGYSYSNEGIDAAGRIIEIVSGMPYEQFLQERLFTPLRMTDTTFFPSEAQLRRLAKCYQTNPHTNGLVEAPIQFLVQPLGGPSHYAAPGGGLFSTASDVTRFCQMLANGGIFEGKTCLSREAVRAMTSKQTPPTVQNNYGFGLGLSASDGSSFGHSGAYKTDMCVDHGRIRVFLVQQASGWADGNPEGEFNTEAARLFPPPAADPRD